MRSRARTVILLLLVSLTAGADIFIAEPADYPVAVNDVPVWSCVPNPVFVEGVAGSYDLCVTDPEAVDANATNQAGCTLPTGISIDNAVYPPQVDATTGTSDAVTAGCVFQASDGVGTADSEAFSITVQASGGDEEVLAFPGAMGWGKNSTGGRTGEVVYVTNLNNSGTGSLRNAVSVGRTAGVPRNVIFAVCGRISLTTDLEIRNGANNGDIYVAGQTAPCPVVVTNAFLFVGAPNITLRFLTFLEGGEVDNHGAVMMGFDPLAHDMILDHVSTGWHADEVFDIVGGDNGVGGKVQCENMYGAGQECPHDLTLMNSIVAEGIARLPGEISPDVGKGWLSYGVNRISGIRNLYASNYRRTPILYDGCTETINTLIYNYGGSGEAALSISGYWDDGHHSVIENFFKPGPTTGGASVFNFIGGSGNAACCEATSTVFATGNRRGASAVSISSLNGATSISDPNEAVCPGVTPQDDPSIMSAVAGDVQTHVLANVGNQLAAWTTDPWTLRILTEAASGTANLGTSGKASCAVGTNNNPACDGSFLDRDDITFPTFETDSYTPATVDTDLDGITNACEDANGLNDASAADGPAISANGYSNLDNFLNYMAGDSVPGGYNAC